MLKHLLILSLLLVGCGPTAVLQGPPGPKGETGAQGQAGTDGGNCTVVSIAPGDAVLPNGGAIITCPGSSVMVSNGAPGAAGQTAYSIVGTEDPCGDSAGVYDEVFLRLANRQLIAIFSDNANGDNARLAFLTPGNYVTTDGSNCSFSVDNDLNLH